MKSTEENANEIFQLNLQSLEENHPQLFFHVKEHPYQCIGEKVATSTVPTFHITVPGKPQTLLYNNEDPWLDVTPHLNPIDKEKVDQKCIFTGLGLGYGPLLVLKERPNVSRMIIFEPSIDIFITALKEVDLRPLITTKKVFFFLGQPDFEVFRSVISHSALDRIHFFNLKPLLNWAPEWYSTINQEVYKIANDVSVTAATTSKHGLVSFKNLMRNLTLLRHANLIDDLEGLFKGKPAILVSAGPSLDKSIPFIKKAVGRAVIISVDAALRPLADAGIIPDFVTSIDVQKINFEKLAPFLNKCQPFSLVVNPKVTPLIPKRMDVRNLIFAFSDNPGDIQTRTLLGAKLTVPYFPSVAHLSLGLALVLEASPIIFVGHDLAYTSEQYDHAKGSVLTLNSKKNVTAIPEDLCTYVKSVHGKKLRTHRGFFEFKIIFEDIIKKYPGKYINATYDGAHIEGTVVERAEDILDRHLSHKISVSPVIENRLSEKDNDCIHQFLNGANSLLSGIKTKKRNVNETAQQVEKLKNLIKESIHLLKDVSGPNHLPGNINLEIIKLNEFKKNSGRLPYIEEIFFNTAVEIDRRISKNENVFSKKYIEGVLGMLDIMAFENKCHIESLDIYGDHLKQLVHHLGTEDKYLSSGHSDNENLENEITLSSLYCDSGDFVLAGGVLERLSGSFFDSAMIHYLKGVVFSGMLDFQSALKHWELASQLDTALSEKIKKYRDEEAYVWIDMFSYRYGPYKAWIERALSIAFDSQGVIEKYLKSFDSYFCSDPEWNKLLVELYFEIGYLDEGIVRLKEAVKMTPETAILWDELGDVLYEAKDFEGAVISYENCFTALPEHIQSIRKIGDCYFEMKRYDAAMAAYENVIEKDPENVFAKENIKRIMKTREG